MEPNVTDWIQAIAEGIAALGIIALLVQLTLTAKQIRLAREQNEEMYRQNNANILWNRMQAAFAFFPEELFIKREMELVEQLRKIDIEFVTKQPQILSSDEADKILENLDCSRATRFYLNVLEDYCLAVNTGLVDDDLAYAQMRATIVARANFFWPLIEAVRKNYDDEEIYCEIELISKRWKEKDQQKRDVRRRIIEDAKLVTESFISDALREMKSSQDRKVYPPERRQ